MKRILAAVAATLGLLVSAGQAAASGPADSALQLAAQAVASGQAAGAQAGAAQSRPANQNVSVRVQSPGSGGDVTQSNTVASGAAATNANVTDQSAAQTQSGSCDCGSGTQAVGQESDSSQAAAALSTASQQGAGNENISVRVQSPGNDGNVSQSNTAASGAAAANANATGQSADQVSAGGTGTQAVGQEADNEQEALAASSAEQKGAKNSNISVRVQSPGDDGDVEQSNTVASAAKAGNLNLTGQDANQAGGAGTQAIGQDAKSDQQAAALSSAEQKGARNEHIAVRVQSPGGGGDVSQANTAASAALAGNANGTSQEAAQTGRGDCKCGSGTQAIGQEAKSEQGALAVSLAAQDVGDRCGCHSGGNSYAPVRVDGKGDGGSVEQSNTVASAAKAGNLNATEQAAGQAQSGGGVQAVGQEAKSEQAAIGLSAALQHGASNSSTPVRVDSRGDDGDVLQSNGVYSAASAGNANLAGQAAGQSQSGSCGCHGAGIQAVGQEADSEQLALAGSLALQLGASNESSPVRVHSPGGGGSLEQSNDAVSHAGAGNLNKLGQSAAQSQGGGGTAIQAIGQAASSAQVAIALSAALQLGASNSSSPVSVGGKADGGGVSQSNDAASSARAKNANLTGQEAAQRQEAACGCDGTPIQALGQSAYNGQFALGLSAALQLAARSGRSMAI